MKHDLEWAGVIKNTGVAVISPRYSAGAHVVLGKSKRGSTTSPVATGPGETR